jgi:hypothetical protein
LKKNLKIVIAKEKSVGIDRLGTLFNESEKEVRPKKLQAQEILWRLEERLWPSLEEKHGNQSLKCFRQTAPKHSKIKPGALSCLIAPTTSNAKIACFLLSKLRYTSLLDFICMQCVFHDFL